MRIEDFPHIPFPEVKTSVLRNFEVRRMKPNEDSCEACSEPATIGFALGNVLHRLCDDCAKRLCGNIEKAI